MYHAVGSPALGDALGLFSISPELFEQHMAVLAERGRGWELGNLDAGLDALSNLKVTVTFDDGYRDNLRVAAPILEKFGIPYTVFVSTSFVRNHAPLFLSPDELRELAGRPLARIGTHGHAHVPLTRCNDAELKCELETSKSYLEDLLGTRVDMIAYPYGDVDRRVRDAAGEAGYQFGACSYEGINNPARDRLLLRRTAILAGDSTRVLRQKLHGDWDWYRWKQRDPAIS